MLLLLMLAAVPACDRPTAPSKVLVLGIDGAEWAIIDRLRAAGRMPVVDGLIRRGTRGHLATITPTLSPALWTTIATGVPPSDHGIHNFVVGWPEAALIMPERPTDEDLVVRFKMRIFAPCRLDEVEVLVGDVQVGATADTTGLTIPLARKHQPADGDLVVTLRLPERCAPPWHGGDLPPWGTLKTVLVRTPRGGVIASPPVWSLVRHPTVVRPLGFDRRGGLLVGQKFRPAKSTDRRVPALWTIASAHGRSVGVVGWWSTYPAELVRGTMISDVLRSHDNRRIIESGEVVAGAASTKAWDERLAAMASASWEVSADDLALFVPRTSPRFAGLLEVPAHVESLSDPELSVLKSTFLFARAYFRIAGSLLRESQPDVFLAYTSFVDVVEHKFWRYMQPEHFANVSREDVEDFGDAIPRAYAWVDRQLGSLLKVAGEDTVVLVVSDHGHHAAQDHAVFSGHHEDGPPGILIAAGPGIRAGAEVTGATIFDIAPTVLATLGLAVAEDLPGRVLYELFDTPPAVTRVPSYRGLQVRLADDGSDEEMDDSVRERLRALGYL